MNPNNLIEEEIYQLTEVVGLVRKGEKENWLVGNRNWPEHGNFQFIDLPYMTNLFRFFNIDSSSSAYIERIIEKYDEDSEGNYPIPATPETFFKPRWTPNKHLEYSTIFGGISLISLTTLALNSMR